MHGNWKSNTVAQTYVEESIASKNRISHMLVSAVSSDKTEEAQDTRTSSDKTEGAPDTRTLSCTEFKTSSSYPHSISGKFENCNFFSGK